jgi:hypothetical protein
MSSSEGKKAFGSIIRMWLLTLLVLTICTCSGPKLMLGNQILGNQTDYSTYSGKLVKPIIGHMGCATLRIDDLDSHLWRPGSALIWQPYQATLGLEYYQSLDQTRRRCLRTRLYRYQLITPSFSNQFRTVWTAPRQNLRTEYPRQNTPVRSLRTTRRLENSTGLTPRSTGRTPVTTRTTVRNSGYSSTTRAVNGSVRRTSSTTGGLRKRVYD